MQFTVRVVDGEQEGTTETLAIYPRALKLIHGPGEHTDESLAAAIKRWMKPIHEAAIERHRMKVRSATAGQAIVGKLIEFEDQG